MGGENPRQAKPDPYLQINMARQDGPFLMAEQKPMEALPIQSLIGAEVRGKVDGAFDSGLLMTANVNGRIFRGILFSPGNGFLPRASVLPPNSAALTSCIPIRQPYSNPDHISTHARPIQQAMPLVMPNSRLHQGRTQPSTMFKGTPSLACSSAIRSDLKDVVLTLGGPGSNDRNGKP